MVAFLLITGIVFILLSLFKRDPQKYYQKLLSNNYETYHELVDFMQQLQYQNVAIYQRSNNWSIQLITVKMTLIGCSKSVSLKQNVNQFKKKGSA